MTEQRSHPFLLHFTDRTGLGLGRLVICPDFSQSRMSRNRALFVRWLLSLKQLLSLIDSQRSAVGLKSFEGGCSMNSETSCILHIMARPWGEYRITWYAAPFQPLTWTLKRTQDQGPAPQQRAQTALSLHTLGSKYIILRYIRGIYDTM